MEHSVLKLLKADFFIVLKWFITAFLLVGALFLYFKIVLGLWVNITSGMLYFQLLFIYQLSMADVTSNIPTYISMSCSRKNVNKALWIRWGYLFLLNEAVFTAGMLTASGNFPRFVFLLQTGSFLFMLGIGTIISIVRYYNKWLSMLVAVLFGAAVGIFTFCVIGDLGSTLLGLSEEIGILPYAGILLFGVVIFLAAAVVRNRYLKKLVVM